MKLALILISTVFLFLVSAQEFDQTEVADSNYDVQSSNVQLLRQEREAKKRKMDKAIKTFTLLFAGQSVSIDKLKSFFVDFCKNFINISWFFAVIFRDFG